MTTCYLCGQPVDGSSISKDHVIPRTLRGKGQPKVKGFDYGGWLPTHPECNNQFGDETYVSKALQLLGALSDPNITTRPLTVPGPGNGHVRLLNAEKFIEKFTEFDPRDRKFFRIHDARADSVTSLEDPDYYTDKPQFDPRKPLSISLSVLTKSAAALLVKRHLDALPNKWNVVGVPYVEDATKAELPSLFGNTKPFAEDIQVTPKRFKASSWSVLYTTSTVDMLFFFLMGDDSGFVSSIHKRFPNCFQFEGKTLMELVGHDWPCVDPTQSRT